MTILPSLVAQAMGRSPYDDEVWHQSGHPPPSEYRQRYQQQYDHRGRPINPDTQQLNRDIIRAHNEVMLAIGVVESEASAKEQADKQEGVRRHRQAETDLAKTLLSVNGLAEQAIVWLVHGMRQQIMVYKDYASLRPPQLLRATGRNWKYYLIAGLPSYLLSDIYEYLWISNMPYSQAFDYILSYLRLHLEIFSFLQRVGLSPTDSFLPTWRFFVPGTSISPLPIPPLPTSLTPASVAGWLGTLAVGLAPFAGFYLFKRYSVTFTDSLKFKFHSILPAPRNRKKSTRAPLGDVTSQYYPDGGGSGLEPEDFAPGGGDLDIGGSSEGTAFPVGTLQPRDRRTSTASGTARPGGGIDEFASDDEGEIEEGRRAIISIEVAPAEPTTSNLPVANDGGADIVGEIRPQLGEGNGAPYEPVYRINKFTLLPSYFAASILGLSTFRLLSTPWEAFVLGSIAGLYSRRNLAGRVVGFGDLALNGLSLGCVFKPWQRWESILAVEGMLFCGLSWVSLGLTGILFRSKVGEEEWEERDKIWREAEEEKRAKRAEEEFRRVVEEANRERLGQGQAVGEGQGLRAWLRNWNWDWVRDWEWNPWTLDD